MSDGKTQVERMAGEAVDPDRLLDGEDPSTTHREDAVHWVRVYDDLLRFKRGLFERAGEIAPELEEVARAEVGKTDITILAAEAARFERRLAFWRRRADELHARHPR